MAENMNGFLRLIRNSAFLLISLVPTLGWAVGSYLLPNVLDLHLQTTQKVSPISVPNIGSAIIVSKDVFPTLDGVTCYIAEIWDESMRLPHWHPNASELGYVVSGTIQIILWRSPGETSVFNVSEGGCWFIPQGSLHSLNNIGDEKATLLVGFSSDRPHDIDLPVAFNGIPAPVRDAYTSPHEDLKKWTGTTNNPLLGQFPVDPLLKTLMTGSPYKFDFAEVTPLFSDPQLGSVTWGIKDNWSVLENISILRAHLKPGTARDAIWYPDVATLYVVSKGQGQFHIVIADRTLQPFDVQLFDYIFVPTGILHTFINNSSEDFEVIAFFTKANPLPEVSLSVATAFFPAPVRNAAMTEYGSEQKPGAPLQYLNFTTVSPYLLKIPTQGTSGPGSISKKK